MHGCAAAPHGFRPALRDLEGLRRVGGSQRRKEAKIEIVPEVLGNYDQEFLTGNF